MRVTVELFVPDTELVPVLDVVEEGVVVVEDDADFVIEDEGLADEEIVADLVVVIVAEGVVEPVDVLELVGDVVDVTEGRAVLLTVAVAEDVRVLVTVLLTELDAVVVDDGSPVLVSVEVIVDVAVPRGDAEDVGVPVVVFELEGVAEEVVVNVPMDDRVVVDVEEWLGLLVVVVLGEPDEVLEALAVPLADADPVDVLDIVAEGLGDRLAEDDLDEDLVASPDGRAELVFDTLDDPVGEEVEDTVFVSVELAVLVLVIEEVRVAEVLPDGVRELVVVMVVEDDADAERLLVGLRVAVAVALAERVPLEELVDVLDAEDVREDEEEAVAVVDELDVFETEGELDAVREADELRVPDEEPLGVCELELDFVPDDEPVDVLETVDVRVDVML